MSDTPTLPHVKNFCGGNFQDWLEVMLTSQCNGICSFCIEKKGFKPKETVHWNDLANIIIASKKKNILLLGGEPTLYTNLSQLITRLNVANLNVSLTTNGSSLMQDHIDDLFGLKTLNISIHDYCLSRNREITGIDLGLPELRLAIKKLREHGVAVRINCNIIKEYIDTKYTVLNFIKFAKSLNVDGVRFAELKNDDRFVDLSDIFPDQFGLNKDPFLNGCWQNAVIDDMPVNFRQLCGMQSDKRPSIANPVQILKKVLYYDGKLYDGWQEAKNMNKNEEKLLQTILIATLEQVEDGDLTSEVAAKSLMKVITAATNEPPSTSGCVY
jgi:organic radical activating enzyme